jgi:hypothetical protein
MFTQEKSMTNAGGSGDGGAGGGGVIASLTDLPAWVLKDNIILDVVYRLLASRVTKKHGGVPNTHR